MKRTICIFIAALLCCSLAAAGKLGLRTVVIDAGHGGSDPGAVSKDKKTFEKNLTLDIADRLSKKIRTAYPDVKVVLTRGKDQYITLDGRAEVANKADADLFISIHINSTTGTSANGYSVHVLGQSSNKNRDLYAYNMDVCRRENSVIMLEEDYSTKYQGFDPSDPESYIFMLLMQNSNLESSLRFAQAVQGKLKGGPLKADRGVWQDPFYVLWKTSMPAVLVELGFISNQNDLAVLRSADNRDDIADRLLDAFTEYKKVYDGSLSVNSPEPVKVEKAPVKEKNTVNDSPVEQPAAEAGEDGVLYGVQIFALPKKIDKKSSQFMGYEPNIVFTGKLYKYSIAVSKEQSETRSAYSKIKSKYPDAFMVKIVGNNSERLR